MGGRWARLHLPLLAIVRPPFLAIVLGLPGSLSRTVPRMTPLLIAIAPLFLGSASGPAVLPFGTAHRAAGQRWPRHGQGKSILRKPLVFSKRLHLEGGGCRSTRNRELRR